MPRRSKRDRPVPLDKEVRKAERTARKSDRLATKAIRLADKMTGDHLPDWAERVAGELLGWGTNAGLGALSMSGIPGVSTAAGVAGTLSSWFGFVQKPGARTPANPKNTARNPGPPRTVPTYSALAHPAGVRPDMTVNRSHFFPQLRTDSVTETAVPIASGIQLKPLEQTNDLPGGNARTGSFRLFLGSLPASAVAGDILASVPLDLLTGRLAGTKAAYEGKEWDLVTWMGASALYLPNSAATASGGIIVVCSPDPTNTIGSVAHDARVDAAFQYGPNMLASNLWETGMAMRLSIDSERKYQSFSVATDSDEALKLGGAGRVEFICSGSYSGSSSPGMLALDAELLFTNQVPITASGSSSTEATSQVIFTDATTSSQVMRSENTDYTWQALVGATAGTGGLLGRLPFAQTPSDSKFDFMTIAGGSIPATSAVGFNLTTPGFVKGGLSALGFRFVSFDTGTAIYTISVPPGSWALECVAGSSSTTMGTITFSGPTVTLNNTRSNTFQTGTISQSTCQVDGGATGSSFGVKIGAPSATPSTNTQSCIYLFRATRVNSTFTRLIDNYCAGKMLINDSLAELELTNTITDAVEAAEEGTSQAPLAAPIARRNAPIEDIEDLPLSTALHWHKRGLITDGEMLNCLRGCK